MFLKDTAKKKKMLKEPQCLCACVFMLVCVRVCSSVCALVCVFKSFQVLVRSPDAEDGKLLCRNRFCGRINMREERGARKRGSAGSAEGSGRSGCSGAWWTERRAAG